jgi:predicted transporter
VETSLAIGAIIVTALYVGLMYYGSRKQWMRGAVSAWRAAALISIPCQVFFAGVLVVTNNLLFGIPTIFMFVSAFISLFEWERAVRYVRTWEIQ